MSPLTLLELRTFRCDQTYVLNLQKLKEHKQLPISGDNVWFCFYVHITFREWCVECRLEKAGHDYTGTVNTTSSGRQCQAWSSNTPHVPSSWYTNASFPDGSISAAENYCRNPCPACQDGVWCYTMDPATLAEICDVPACGKSTKFLRPTFSSSYCIQMQTWYMSATHKPEYVYM